MPKRNLIYFLSFLFLAISCSESIDTNKKIITDEVFEDFYKIFREDEKFRIERTIFPIKVISYTGGGALHGSAESTTYLSKEDIVNGKKTLYVKEEIVKSQGYTHVINKEDETKIKVLVGPPVSEAAVGYIFEKRNKQWFLVEHVDYWGS